MGYEIKTVRGFDLYEVASALQKSIRRNQPKIAGYFALELYHSGYARYAWKRLITISAEDCHGIVTREIKALLDSWEWLKKKAGKETPPGRIFLSKAVLILCDCLKNRDPDHLQNLVYDSKGWNDRSVAKYLEGIEVALEKRENRMIVPDYAFDIHTKKGRQMGKTKADFFRDEYHCLEPKQPGLFDNLVK